MSKSERRQPDLAIDDLLHANDALLDKARNASKEISIFEVPFVPVSHQEVIKFTNEVREIAETEGLQERLSNLKDSATALIMVGETGKLVPNGSENIPNSRDLVSKAYEVKKTNNITRIQNLRNELLAHVLSTDPGSLEGTLQKKVKAVQKRYVLLHDVFDQLPKVES